MLSADDVAEDMSVGEDDLQAAYQERSGEFTRAGAAKLPPAGVRRRSHGAAGARAPGAGRRISTPSPPTPERRRTRPRSAPFGASSCRRSWRRPSSSCRPASRSAPIKTSLGWHIVEVTAVEPGQVQAFAEAKDRLAADLKREKAVESLIDLGNKLEDALGRGATLQEAAGELGLPLRTIETIDARGQDAHRHRGSGSSAPIRRDGVRYGRRARRARSIETGNERLFPPAGRRGDARRRSSPSRPCASR